MIRPLRRASLGAHPIPLTEATKPLKNLFRRAQSFARSPEGKRMINQAGRAARSRGGRRGRTRPAGGGLMGLAQQFLGRGRRR